MEVLASAHTRASPSHGVSLLERIYLLILQNKIVCSSLSLRRTFKLPALAIQKLFVKDLLWTKLQVSYLQGIKIGTFPQVA